MSILKDYESESEEEQVFGDVIFNLKSNIGQRESDKILSEIKRKGNLYMVDDVPGRIFCRMRPIVEETIKEIHEKFPNSFDEISVDVCMDMESAYFYTLADYEKAEEGGKQVDRHTHGNAQNAGRKTKKTKETGTSLTTPCCAKIARRNSK